MNAPMQLSSSNSLISLAMTSSPGKTTTGEQELWFRDGMRTAGFYCPDEGRPREPQALSTGALLVRGDTRDRADRSALGFIAMGRELSTNPAVAAAAQEYLGPAHAEE